MDEIVETETKVIKRDRLTNAEMDNIARLGVECIPVGDIAKITGVSVKKVTKLFEGGNETFDRLREQWQTMAIDVSTRHRRNLIGLMQDAHSAVEVALGSEDKKVAADNAWKLFDNLGLNPKTPRGDTFNVHLGDNTQHNYGPREIEATSQNVIDIHAKTQELGHFAKDVGDFTKHLLKGTEALPTPEAQIRVVEGEALPPRKENGKFNFTLKELDPDD